MDKGDNMSEKTTNNVPIADYFADLKSRRTKLDDINMMINWKPVEARLKKSSQAYGKCTWQACISRLDDV